jgi:ubiquinone/menaquinone biosynthesis C-methylase UbiE
VSGTKLDFSFDTRVVGQYDALRGHPPAVSAAIAAAVADTAGAGARVLELGVGTGRIALPVAAAGCPVTGIDLSGDMLAALHKQLPLPAGAGVDLVRGDIAALPFRDKMFDAAMATHVLHLVPDWKAVLGGLVRVVRDGGALLLGRDWVDPASMAGQIRMAFRQAVMQAGFRTAAPAGGQPLADALIAAGAQPVRVGPQELVAAEWQAEVSAAQVLDGIRSRDDAESWVLPDEVLTPVAATLDRFAASQWPETTTPQTVLRRFVFSIWRVGPPA